MSDKKHDKVITTVLWIGVSVMLGSAILLGITAFNTSKKLKPKKTPVTPTDTSGNTPTTHPANNTYSSTGFPLSMGSTGSYVRQLQVALNNAGQSISVDGIFGSQTEKALQNVTGYISVDSVSELNDIINTDYSALKDDTNPLLV